MIDRAPGEDGPEAADRGWLDLSGYADVEPDAVGSAGELAALRGLLRDVPRDVPGWDGMLLRAVTVEPVDLAHEAADAFDEEADAPRSTPTDADEQAAWDVEADEWDGITTTSRKVSTPLTPPPPPTWGSTTRSRSSPRTAAAHCSADR